MQLTTKRVIVRTEEDKTESWENYMNDIYIIEDPWKTRYSLLSIKRLE